MLWVSIGLIAPLASCCFQLRTYGEIVATPIVPTAVNCIRFPKIGSQLLFSQNCPSAMGKTGIVALNEWLLSGGWLGKLSVRHWALAVVSNYRSRFS